jgi:transcriptional regulator with XRE-family HTH domain
MSIGSRILELRQSKGLSRNELANKVGLTSVAIYNYETGRRIPNAMAVAKIATALGATTDHILGFEKLEIETIPFYDIDKIDTRTGEGIETDMMKLFGADFATKVPDDSMFPDFKKGDIVFLKQVKYSESSGKVCLVRIGDDKSLRKLEVINRGEYVLKATNPIVHDVEVETMKFEMGELEVLGIVVGRATQVN